MQAGYQLRIDNMNMWGLHLYLASPHPISGMQNPPVEKTYWDIKKFNGRNNNTKIDGRG